MALKRKSTSSSQLALFGQAARIGPARKNGQQLELNERQREAVEHVKGPMLVVAGAGTGKTLVLTKRIARLIREGHARSDEILAVTYTENAAAELKKRVAQELGGTGSEQLKAMTYHAYCFKILKSRGKDFGVVEKEDLWVYLRRRLPELELNYYTRAVRPAQFLESLLDFFDNCHDELKTADDYERYVEELAAGKHELARVTRSKDAEKLLPEEIVARCREIARVFRKVEAMLERDGLGTFAHMILGTMNILRADAEALREAQKKARFILIDEFQDSNIAQIELAQLLAGTERNIFVVGDPDQAIYRFRGASSAAFDEFVTRFPGSRAVMLDRNQRSTSAILNCSYSVVNGNPSVGCSLDGSGRKFQRRPLISERERRAKTEGKKLEVVPTDIVMVGGSQDEAVDLVNQIEKIVRQHNGTEDLAGPPKCAVLYRTHAHRREVVKELALRGIPFRVEGLNTLETCEIRDLLSCLRCLEAPADNDSLFRVAALEIFVLDGETMREALRRAGKGANMSSILAGLPAGKVVLHTIENARAEAAAAEWRTDETVEIVIKRFGLASNAPAISAFRKFVANWQQKAMTVSGRLSEFLEYMKYFREASGVVPFDEVVDEADGSAVALMTVHAAKGLEFDHVFVIRANTSSFPTTYKEKLFEMPRALRDPHCLVQTDGPELHKQEERRLFYVAMTRARDALTLYNKPKGVRNPRPSGFIRELMDSPTAQPSWRVRSAETTVELQAAAANVSPVSIGRWLLLGPSTRVLDGALSATAVESYEMCPLRFKIQRDWNIPGEIAASLQFGAAMHDTLKDFFDATCQDRPRSCDQVFQIFKQALADRYFDDEHQRDLYRQQGLMQLEQFLNSYSRNRAPDVLSTERTFELLVDGVRVRGRIDRMDRIHGDCIAIIDYKSGAPKTETDARKSLQLSIYAMAAHELWKLLPTRLIYYNLDNSEEVVATRNENELQEARDRILSVARRIAAGEFEPNPGFHCRSCPYSAMCPATEERLYTTPKSPGRSN